MITADQLLCHAIGDYILQSHWMATEKTKQSLAAALHALTYTIPFLLLSASIPALAVICVTHFVIDRWRVARFVVAAKNLLGPVSAWPDSRALEGTGYDPAVPPWLAVWLLIIADNVLHVTINGAALAWL